MGVILNLTTMKQLQNTAATKRTVSEATEALITAKCKILDLHNFVLTAMEETYGNRQSDRFSDEIYKAIMPLRELVDSYIIDSIDENLGSLSSTTF